MMHICTLRSLKYKSSMVALNLFFFYFAILSRRIITSSFSLRVDASSFNPDLASLRSYTWWPLEIVGEGLAWVELLEVDVANAVELDQVSVVLVGHGNLFVSGVGGVNPGILVRVVVKAVLNQVPVMSKEISRGVKWVGESDWDNLQVLGCSLIGLRKLKDGSVEWVAILMNTNFSKTILFINPQEVISDWSGQLSCTLNSGHEGCNGNIFHFYYFFIL